MSAFRAWPQGKPQAEGTSPLVLRKSSPVDVNISRAGLHPFVHQLGKCGLRGWGHNSVLLIREQALGAGMLE